MNIGCAGLPGLRRIAIRAACGMTSLSSSSRFTVSSVDRMENPVVLPPGRARPATKPRPNGSAAAPMTMGMADRRGTSGHDDIDLRPQQTVDQRGYGFDIIAIMAKLIGNVAPFDITEVAHPAHEFLAKWIVPRGSRPDVPDTRRLARLLRTRCERPGRRRAAEQPDERAPIHVWMAPAWQEIIWRAAQRSLAVMCPACWCSPGGLLALMGCANRDLIIRTGSMSR